MSALRRINGFGLLAGALLIAGSVLAATETMELMTYYPPSGDLPDPFRVERQTVGTPYLNTNTVPAESMIVAGPLGIRTSTPGLDIIGGGATINLVDIGPRDNAGTLGGAALFAPAGTNRWMYMQNDAGMLKLITNTDDAGAANGENEKLRILNSGYLGIFLHSTGVVDPTAPLYIGPRDGANAGGLIRFSGAAANTYYQLENASGQFRLSFQNGGASTETWRIMNNGQQGIYNINGTAAADAAVSELLTLGAENNNAGSLQGPRMRIAGAGGNDYLEFQNVNGDCQIFSTSGGATPIMTIRNDGTVGIGTTAPVGALQVVGDTVVEGDLKLGGVVTSDTLPGVRIQPTNAVGSTFSGGVLTEPSTNTNAYGFYFQRDTINIIGVPTVEDDMVIGDYNSGTNKLNRRIVGKNGRGIVPGPEQNGQIAFHGEPYMLTSTSGYMFTVYGLAHCNVALVNTQSVTAGRALKVVGTAMATGTWTTAPSSVSVKTNVIKMTPAEEFSLSARMNDQTVYSYKLKYAGLDERRFLGVLAEETPLELLDDRQEAICVDDYVPSLIALIRMQQAEIEALRGRIEQLKRLKAARAEALR
jgi:hypothetical protein